MLSTGPLSAMSAALTITRRSSTWRRCHVFLLCFMFYVVSVCNERVCFDRCIFAPPMYLYIVSLCSLLHVD